MFAGISIEQAGEQPAFEVLRVARGRIIDRWTPGIRWFQATEFADIALRASGLTDIATTLVRVAIPAGVEHRWHAVGPGFLSIESGSAMVHVTHGNGDEETLELESGLSHRGDIRRSRSTSICRRRAGNGADLFDRPAGSGGGVPPGQRAGCAIPGSDAIVALEWAICRRQMKARFIAWQGSSCLPETRFASLAQRMPRWSSPSIPAHIELGRPEERISILGEDLWPAEHAQLRQHRCGPCRVAHRNRASISLRNASEHPVTIVLVVVRIDSQSGPLIG